MTVYRKIMYNPNSNTYQMSKCSLKPYTNIPKLWQLIYKDKGTNRHRYSSLNEAEKEVREPFKQAGPATVS